MSGSSGGTARGRAVLVVLGATLVAALSLAASGMARPRQQHRSAYTASIARAHRLARHLRGAAVRETFAYAR